MIPQRTFGRDASTGEDFGLPSAIVNGTQLISDLLDTYVGLSEERFIELQDIRTRRDGYLMELLETRTNQLARRSPAALAETLGAAYGFAWRDVARLASVSVPALRKWRLGEPAVPANLRRLAKVVAICDILHERCPDIADVASWLELPLSEQAPITGIDLLVAERYDLVSRHAGDQTSVGTAILDAYDPDWRTVYASDVKIYTGQDGFPSLRLGYTDEP